MKINKLRELVALAEEADLLQNKTIQNMLISLGLDDDGESEDDFRELLELRVMKKIISPDPFYPLPEGSEINGEIELGKVGDTGTSFGLSLDEMTQHILIAGRSGSGKTTLIYNMINQLLDRGISFWCFDFKKEFRGFIRKSNDVLVLRPEDFKFNPLRPPDGIPPLRWASTFCDVFSHSMSLLEGSNSFLLDQVINLYDLFEVFYYSDTYPSLHELVNILEHISLPLSSRNARYLEVVKNRLLSCVLTVGDMLDCDRDMMDDLLDQNKSIIFEFYGISEHVTSFLIEMLLAKLYFYRMDQGRKLSRKYPLVVFMDEARSIYDYRKEMNPAAGIPIIDTITERIRDFGVSLVICSQIPSELCTSAKSNTYTKIMMSLGNGKDISDLAMCMGLNPNQANLAHYLEVGSAIVKLSDRYTRPFWIRTPLIKMDKDISDFELEEKMEPMIAELDVSPVVMPERYERYIGRLEGRRKTEREDEIPSIAEELLIDIFNNPYVPVTKRYESLGLSRKKGKAVKDYLIKNNFVTETNIKISNSISNFLILTRRGLEFCEEHGCKGNLWREITTGKVSFRHRFYQFLIKEYLTRDGWDVNLESQIDGNRRVDVEAIYRTDGETKRRIAIEVAVTKFEIQDLMKCINDGFDEVRVVCRDETARKRIESVINSFDGKKKRDSVVVQTINGLLNNMPQKP